MNTISSNKSCLSPAHKLTIIFVGIAAITKLFFIYLVRDHPFVLNLAGDEREHFNAAIEILEGGIIRKDAFYFAPLYPYLLAGYMEIFGRSSLMGIRVMQALLGAVNVGVMYQLGRKAFGSESAGIASALLTLFCGTFYFFEALIHKETLSILLGNIALWYLIPCQKRSQPNIRDVALAGFLLGITVHMRGNNLILIIFIFSGLIFLAWKTKENFKSAVLFLCMAIFALLPATIHNAIAAHDFVLTTYQGGANLYIGNHEGADGGYESLRPRRQVSTFEKIDAREIAESEEQRPLRPSEIDAFWRHKAMKFMMEHPLEFISLTIKKFILLHGPQEMGDTTYYHHFSDRIHLMTIFFVSWPLILGLAIPGIMISLKKRESGMLLLCLFASVISVVAFFIMSRYKAPLFGFYILFAAYFIGLVHKWYQNKKFALIIGWFAISILVWAITGTGDISPQTGAEYNNMGIKLQQLGRFNEAKEQFAGAVRIEPLEALFHANYARLLEDMHQDLDAIAEWKKSLEILDRESSHRTDSAWSEEVVTALARIVALQQKSHILDESLSIRLANERRKYIERLKHQADLGPSEWIKIAENEIELLEWNQAFLAYDKSIELDPRNDKIYVQAGLARIKAQRVDEAEKFFQKALALNPENTSARKFVGNIRYMQKKYNEALEEWTKALKGDEGDEPLRQQIDTLKNMK